MALSVATGLERGNHIHPFELLVSTAGIAAASAIQLLGELLVLPENMRAKQWVAMAGPDPRAHQSRASVNMKPRLSKAGNRYLRIALYMPALRGCTKSYGRIILPGMNKQSYPSDVTDQQWSLIEPLGSGKFLNGLRGLVLIPSSRPSPGGRGSIAY